MNITDVKNILDRKLAGASIDDVEGISDFTLFKEAAVNLLTEINPTENVRGAELEVFQDIFDYTPPADFRDLVDQRPQTETRRNDDNSTRRFSESFDQRKINRNNDFSIEYRDGSKLLRYAREVTGKIQIHNMESTTTNGTWDGTASNIAASTFRPYKGSASISADYDTGETITNNDMTVVDLSDHENKSTLFLPGFFPDASFVTNINLQWGSSDTVYFDRTVTAPHFGSFKNGWNVLAFAWNGATETGTVDTENINFLKITPTLGTSDTDIKFGPCWSSPGELRDIIYHSKYLFRSSTGTWKETPTIDTDVVNLDSDTENLFVYECVRLAALGIQGQDSLYQEYNNILYGEAGKPGAYSRYKTRNPDEDIKPQTQHRTIRYNKK